MSGRIATSAMRIKKNPSGREPCPGMRHGASPGDGHGSALALFDNTPRQLQQRQQVQGMLGRALPIQRQANAEDYLSKVIFYVGELERYSHQGYPKFGKRTRQDVLVTRYQLVQAFGELPPEEKDRVRQRSVDTSTLPVPDHLRGMDPNLIYFHALHLHLEPLASVSYQGDVSGYHGSNVAPQLNDWRTSGRNYATLYYDIHVVDKSSRPRTLQLSGSYAGRSGEYEVSTRITAPAQSGFEQHTVPSTTSPSPSVFEFFEDRHSREFDSEVAIFEDLTQVIVNQVRGKGIVHPEYSGSVQLYSDRATCNSCTAVAMQFQNKFDAAVRVVHGGVDDSKGYV